MLRKVRDDFGLLWDIVYPGGKTQCTHAVWAIWVHYEKGNRKERTGWFFTSYIAKSKQ